MKIVLNVSDISRIKKYLSKEIRKASNLMDTPDSVRSTYGNFMLVMQVQLVELGIPKDEAFDMVQNALDSTKNANFVSEN